MLNNILMTFLMIFVSISCKVTDYAPTNDDDVVKIEPIKIENYNLDNTGKTDVTKLIQKILDTKQKLILSRGTYRVDGTIVVKANCSLILENAVNIKKSVNGTDGPIVFVSGPFSTLKGDGSSSVIHSLKNSPRGIIALGHDNMTTKQGNTLYNTISGLRVIGSQIYGGKDRVKDIGIWVPNRQLSGANYFNTIENIVVAYVDIGIQLSGHANANSIRNINIVKVGDEADDYGILLEGAQENRIYDVFHHYSPNGGATIGVKELTIGKVVYSPNFNNITHIISEPGGICKCAEITAGRWNKFDLICNNGKPEKVTIDMGVNHCEYRRNGGIIAESLKARNYQQSLLKITNSKDCRLSLNNSWNEINCFDKKVIDNGYVFNNKARVKLNQNISKKGIFKVTTVLNFNIKEPISVECALFINNKKQGASRVVNSRGNNQQVTIDIQETLSMSAGQDLNCQCRSLNGPQPLLMEKENSYFQIEKKSDI